MLSNIRRAAIQRAGAGTSRSSTNKVLLTIWDRWVDGSRKAQGVSPGYTPITLPIRSYATATKATQTSKPRAKKPSTTIAKTTEAAPKKPLKKPIKKKVKKAVKKPKAKPKANPKRKVLTDEQKARREILELKKTALSPPPRPGTTVWNTVFSDYQKLRSAGDASARVKELSREAAAKYKSLTPAELEQYNHRVNEINAAKEIALKTWIESHTPEQIRLANNARKLLNKRQKGGKAKQLALLNDPRQPKRPVMPWNLFLAQRWASGDMKGMSISDAAKLLRKEFNELPPGDLKSLETTAESSRQQYTQEYKTVFHRDSASKPHTV